MTQVTMINTVTSREGEYLGGEEYDLPTEVADDFINKGYASGDPSRKLSADELVELLKTTQKVGA